MSKNAFRQWTSSVDIKGERLQLRASVQPKPEPAAICIATSATKGVVVIPLEDWQTLAATVEALMIEAELSGELNEAES